MASVQYTSAEENPSAVCSAGGTEHKNEIFKPYFGSYAQGFNAALRFLTESPEESARVYWLCLISASRDCEAATSCDIRNSF